MKLRQGLRNDMLCKFCQISDSSCSCILNTWLRYVSTKLKSIISWPSREQIKMHMPKSMQIYPTLMCTLDCTEMFIDRPRERELQAITMSDNKKHNTVKCLVCIAPNGSITYLSNA